MLTSLELEDVENIMTHWNDLELRQYLNTSIPMVAEEEKKWIMSTWKDRQKGIGYVFAIRSFDGKFIGTCGVTSISSINRTGVIGISIHGKENWGKGLGTDAMITLVTFAFQIINLNRVELEVYEFNERAIKSYLKVGFKEVGRRRKAVWIEGKYIDSVIMDFLYTEFKEKYGDISLRKNITQI